MPLSYDRDGYRFRADAQTLAIESGSSPITLRRAEVERLGLDFRDDYRIPLDSEVKDSGVTSDLMAALNDALRRCSGPQDSWLRLNLRRAMVLIGGLDETVAQEILDQEGL